MAHTGWICPKCKRVWAPGMPSCQPCNHSVRMDGTEISVTTAISGAAISGAQVGDPAVSIGILPEKALGEV